MSYKAKESYQSYLYASNHKAFAIAPGGAWSWRSEQKSKESAADAALNACQENTAQQCVLYALDNEVVFDEAKWSTLWGPYLDATEAAKRKIGVSLGDRFPNLSFKDAAGKSVQIEDFRGKVTIVHFWGSWCPPCLRELPSMAQFASDVEAQLKGEVKLVLLQVREPFSWSAQWLEKQGFKSLDLYDSGHQGEGSHELKLVDGGVVEDRHIAANFPSSYVIDRNGVILFRHRGPVHNWNEYLPFFNHVVTTTATKK